MCILSLPTAPLLLPTSQLSLECANSNPQLIIVVLELVNHLILLRELSLVLLQPRPYRRKRRLAGRVGRPELVLCFENHCVFVVQCFFELNYFLLHSEVLFVFGEAGGVQGLAVCARRGAVCVFVARAGGGVVLWLFGDVLVLR